MESVTMKRSIPIVTAAAIVFAYLTLSGCAGIGKQLDPPRVSLANIRVEEVSGLETAFEIQMRVFNANDVALKVKGIKAELEINGWPLISSSALMPLTFKATSLALNTRI